MKLGQMGHQLAQGIEAYRVAQFFAVLLTWIAGMHAISVHIFTRRGFGERHISKLNLLFGLTAIGCYSGIGNLLISGASGENFSALMEFMYTVALVMSAYHLVIVWLRNRRKEVWHSMYSGTPWLVALGLPEGFTKRWIEPLALFAIGYYFRNHHQHALGLWLFIGSASVFLHETIAEYMDRAQALDQRDAWIESSYMSDALAGTQPKNLGYARSTSSIALMKQTNELGNGMDTLSADVRGIMDAA